MARRRHRGDRRTGAQLGGGRLLLRRIVDRRGRLRRDRRGPGRRRRCGSSARVTRPAGRGPTPRAASPSRGPWTAPDFARRFVPTASSWATRAWVPWTRPSRAPGTAGSRSTPVVDLLASISPSEAPSAPTTPYAADLRFESGSTSLDPFLRALLPTLPPPLGLIVTGQVAIRGPLDTPRSLSGEVAPRRAVAPLSRVPRQEPGARAPRARERCPDASRPCASRARGPTSRSRARRACWAPPRSRSRRAAPPTFGPSPRSAGDSAAPAAPACRST